MALTQQQVDQYDVSTGFGMRKVEELQKLGATRQQIVEIGSKAPIVGDEAARLFPELSMQNFNAFYDLGKVPPEFNWIEYLKSNPDLYNAGINTAIEAKRHYVGYGYKENRPNAPAPLESRLDRYRALRTEIENQYKALVKLAPAAAYQGRSSDLNAIFNQQAQQLADAGVRHLGELQVKDGRLINKTTGMPVTTSNLGGAVSKDGDTGVNKWGDIFTGVEGGANYGIQELPDGSVLLFPAWEKTKSPISQIGLSFLEPIIVPIATIAGTVIGGPVGAGVGNSIGQFLASGEVELEKALVAAATVYVGSEISAATGGSAESIGASVAPQASAATQVAIGEAAINAGVGAGIYAASGGDPLTGAILGAAGSVTSTTYAQTVGKSFAPTATAATQITIGNSILNAGLSGVVAAATGADVSKSMLVGAAKGAVIANTKEIAEAVVGKENIAAVVNATNLTTAQVENIIATSVANGVIAEVANTGEFAETMVNTLVSNGVSTSVANSVVNNINLDVAQEKAIFSATRNLASVATNASLEGKDVGLALEMAAPGAILSGYQAYEQELDRQDAIKLAEDAKRAAEQEVDARIGGFETPPPPVQGDFPTKIEAINQTALDIASGKIQVAGLPFLAIGASVGAHAALVYLVSQYELMFPDDVELQQQALEANPIYIEIKTAAPSTVKSEIEPTRNKPKLIVKPKPEIAPNDATQLEDVTIKVKSDPSLVDAQRISDDVFELLKELFQEPPPPPKPELPPPEPVKLTPGAPADQAPGVTGEEGQRGVAGGVTGLDLQKRPTVSGQPLREDIFNRILIDELNRLENELQKANEKQKQTESNLQRAQEQQRKFSTPDIIAAAGPGLAEVLEEELNLAARSAEEARAARNAVASQRSEIGALQRGEGTFSDEQLLDYLRTGQLPLGGGEGTGKPGTRGPGTGADKEGPGPGGLEEGDESGAGDRGVGPGAGQEGTEVGGGGEGEGGAGELRTPLSPSLIFSRSLPARPETTPFASRVTGEALEGILGEKQPLFGGDDDEQRAVWNRRSLRLLSRALGI